LTSTSTTSHGSSNRGRRGRCRERRDGAARAVAADDEARRWIEFPSVGQAELDASASWCSDSTATPSATLTLAIASTESRRTRSTGGW
jgi:hypothetical protein